MNVQIWQCGGQLLFVPCSRVGHIYRLQGWQGNPPPAHVGSSPTLKVRLGNLDTPNYRNKLLSTLQWGGVGNWESRDNSRWAASLLGRSTQGKKSDQVGGPPGFTCRPTRLRLVHFLRADVVRGACAKNNTPNREPKRLS